MSDSSSGQEREQQPSSQPSPQQTPDGPTPREIARSTARLNSSRNMLGLLNIVLFIGILLFDLFADGFTPPGTAGIVATLIGGGFWWVAGLFVAHPSESILNNLKSIMISYFVVALCYVIGTPLYWGEFYVGTGLAAMLFLAATFFMNQFTTEGTLRLL